MWWVEMWWVDEVRREERSETRWWFEGASRGPASPSYPPSRELTRPERQAGGDGRKELKEPDLGCARSR